MPEQQTEVALGQRLTDAEMKQIRRGFIPEQMEDKWFIFWRNNVLSFHRSWTGHCMYQVTFEKDLKGWYMLTAVVNRDPAQYQETDNARDAERIQYLVDVLLLKKPHSFPAAGDTPEMAAVQEWSFAGHAPFKVTPNE